MSILFEVMTARTDCVNSNSMSHEFYQIMVGAPSMSLYSWKQLARWSIDYSCLSMQEKIQGHEILNKEWKLFSQNIIKDYGHLMDDDDRIDEETAKETYFDWKQKQ
jgi:adenosine deaminase CECR1